MLIYHSIISASEVGVPTIPLIEYEDDDQFEQDKTYIVGVLENEAFTRAVTCRDVQACKEQVIKLTKVFGKSAPIFFKEDVENVFAYMVTVSGVDDVVIEPSTYSDETDEIEVSYVIGLLTDGFDYNTTMNLVLHRMTETGQLYLHDIAYVGR